MPETIDNGSQKIVLNCNEHVSDTNTDSEPETSMHLESKVFPQQRFSPLRPSEITNKPKPIKGDLFKGQRSFGLVARDDGMLPRPASTGSTFQPKGAVFKVHTPKPRPESLLIPKSEGKDSRPSSVKSDSNVPMLQKDQPTATSTMASGRCELQRSNSIGGLQQHMDSGTKSANHVKTIHNISMTTPDKYGIVMSSNVQTNLSKNTKGAIMGKMTYKFHKGSSPKSSTVPIIAMSFSQPQPNKAPVPTTSVIGMMSRSLSTSGESSAPVSIASKPVTTATNSAATLKINTTLAALNLQAPTVMTPTANGNGTVLVPGTVSSQYGAVTFLNTGLASSVARTTSVANQGFIAAPVQNMMTSQNSTSLSQSTASLVNNIILKVPPTGGTTTQTVQSLVTPQVQPVQISQSQLLTAPRGPTHVQYILPSFTIPVGSNGKVQNLLALPGTSLQASNIQLTLPNQQFIQTVNPQQKVQLNNQTVKLASTSTAVTLPSAPTTPTTPQLTQPSLLQPTKIIVQTGQPQIIGSQPSTQQPTVQLLTASQANAAQPTVQVLTPTVAMQQARLVQTPPQIQPQQIQAVPLVASQIVSVAQSSGAMVTAQPLQLAQVAIGTTHVTQQQQYSQQAQVQGTKILISSTPK